MEDGTSENVCKEIIEYNISGKIDHIQLIINSSGGSCPAGFAIVDIMEWSRLPIYTTGIGMILGQALCDYPVLKARTVRRIIAHVAPEFTEGLFEIRPCVRKLKYIGCGCEEPVCSHGNDFFKMGEIFESIDFNGATYTIKGYRDGMERIGSAYFDRIN